MEQDLAFAVDIGRRCLVVAVQLALPILAAGLVIGLLISILQAATQIQEQTLTFVPKMFIVVAALYLLMPWLIQVMLDYTVSLIHGMGTWFA